MCAPVLEFPPILSIVIPTLNESDSLSVLLEDLERVALRRMPSEIIVVDGGSRDDTRAMAQKFGARVLIAEASRGGQLQAGLLASRGETVWFLHADSRVDAEICEALEPQIGEPVWGRFNVRLGDEPVPLGCRIIASVMNVRSRLTCIATGDQGIFAARALLEQIGGVPNQPLMEDIELSLRLRRLAPPTCLTARLQTSRRRWEEGGLVDVTGQMVRLRFNYFLGASAQALAQQYYRERD